MLTPVEFFASARRRRARRVPHAMISSLKHLPSAHCRARGQGARMPRLFAALVIAVGLAALATPASVRAEDRLDYEVSGGHFYTQANGSPAGPNAGGFAISDANNIPFWSYFTAQGGTGVLGYPLSNRVLWAGYVC